MLNAALPTKITPLKKNASASANEVDEALFAADEEKSLHKAVATLLPDHQNDLNNRDYQAALERLAGLRDNVDGYFDQVMVMAEDEQVRANRLAQLDQLRRLFLDVADLSCIPSA